LVQTGKKGVGGRCGMYIGLGSNRKKGGESSTDGYPTGLFVEREI
jgi:hypothetical protein